LEVQKCTVTIVKKLISLLLISLSISKNVEIDTAYLSLDVGMSS